MSDAGSPGAPMARRTETYAWPLSCLLLVLLPQLLIPSDLRVGPPRVVPIAELVIFAILLAIALRPGPVPRGSYPALLWLFGLLVVANVLGASRLVYVVLGNEDVDGIAPSVGRLLVAGVLVLATNIVTFALVYWQVDDGGPAGRTASSTPLPDFQFPQTSAPELAPPGWVATFPDYLYVAYTNVVAFSPTDAMPLTTRMKGLMALQSLVSMAVLVVVLSRVINILPT